MDISRGIKTRRGGISILVVNMKVLCRIAQRCIRSKLQKLLSNGKLKEK